MSKKMNSLAIAALDEWSHLKDLQQLLEIAIDQLEGSDKLTLRLELLITAYLSIAELRLDELRTALEKIRQLAKVENDQEFLALWILLQLS